MSRTTITYKDIAPGADEVAVFTSENTTGFSDPTRLRAENDTLPISTFELNSWLLDGKHTVYNGETVPFWSDDISDGDCVFESPPVLEITFPAQFSSLGITLMFDSGIGNFCSHINVKWYQQDTLIADTDFHPDSNSYFCQQKAEVYDRIVISFLETWLPYQRVKLQQVIFGIIRKFDMTEIRTAKITNQTNLISAEIPVSTLNWVLESRKDIDFMFQLKQPVEVENNTNFIGVYYIEEHKRTGKSTYRLMCKDAIGVLNDDTFDGGVYTDYSARQLMLDIIGGDFDVEFDGVEDMELTGVVQSATKRSALQQVAFAWGVTVATDGGRKIKVFHPGSTAETIGPDRTYIGANVETASIVTEVRVTAHTYTKNTNGSIEINGVKYNDAQSVYTVRNPNVSANDKRNIKEVTGATLVSPSVGQATAQRVYDYYTKRKTANTKIVWQGELLGDCITVPNAWDNPTTGNVEKMDITLSNTVAADCEVV